MELLTLPVLFAIAIVCGVAMAFSIGANDVANSMSATLGAKALSLRKVLIVATVFEFLGSVLLGNFVTQRIATGFIGSINFPDMPVEREMRLFIAAMISVLVGSGLWVFIATICSLPVSTTHAIVGSVVGIGVLLSGWGSINWWSMGQVAASWVLSPLIGGIFACICWFFLQKFVIHAKSNQRKRIFIVMPIFFGLTIFILSLFLVYQVLKSVLSTVPIYIVLPIALVVALVSALLVQFLVVKRLQAKVDADVAKLLPHLLRGDLASIEKAGLLQAAAEDEELAAAAKNVDSIEVELPPLAVNVELPLKEEEELDRASSPARQVAITLAIQSYNPQAIIAGEGSNSSNSNNNMEQQFADNTSTITVPSIGEKSVPAPEQFVGGDASTSTNPAVSDNQQQEQPEPSTISLVAADSTAIAVTSENDDEPKTEAEIAEKYAFNFLVILTSCCIAMAHGSNDIANACGPLSAATNVFLKNGLPEATDIMPFWPILITAVGLVIGLCTLGYRVMITIGHKITRLTPSRAFVMQLTTSTLTLTASFFALPLSTTHIVVGAIYGISTVDYFLDHVNTFQWKLIIGIAVTWIVTIPFAAGFSIGVYYLLSLLV